MPEKFKNKYRIPSSRLQNWNYGSSAAYFITICTAKREYFFGGKKSGDPGQRGFILSSIGKIVENEWLKTPEIRADMNLQMGEFVVMPNHFHGIIVIGENQFNVKMQSQIKSNLGVENESHSPRGPIAPSGNKFGPQSKNLGSIIRGFKSSVTIQARILEPSFAWQPRFHDHVVRDAKSFSRISAYIINNPKKWNEDKFYNK